MRWRTFGDGAGLDRGASPRGRAIAPAAGPLWIVAARDTREVAGVGLHSGRVSTEDLVTPSRSSLGVHRPLRAAAYPAGDSPHTMPSKSLSAPASSTHRATSCVNASPSSSCAPRGFDPR